MKASAKVFWLVVASVGTGTLALGAEPFQVDTVHSSVIFRVKHMQASLAYGRFNDVAGKFLLDEADPGQSTFDLAIKAESLDTASAARDKHLKGTDFFNTKQFPSITFKSKSVSKTAAGYDVAGDLTLHGITRPATFKLSVIGSGKGRNGESLAGVEATTVLKRSDFGMTFMVGPIGDEVTVIAALEGNRK